MMKIFARFMNDESGATSIEYGLIAALIAVGIIGAASLLGDGLTIACADGAVRLLQVQREGKGAMDAAAFLRTLAPVLRHHGSRINLETHGDSTTFELIRLIEEATQLARVAPEGQGAGQGLPGAKERHLDGGEAGGLEGGEHRPQTGGLGEDVAQAHERVPGATVELLIAPGTGRGGPGGILAALLFAQDTQSPIALGGCIGRTLQAPLEDHQQQPRRHGGNEIDVQGEYQDPQPDHGGGNLRGCDGVYGRAIRDRPPLLRATSS